MNETNVVKTVSLERPLHYMLQVGFGRKSDGLLHITEERKKKGGVLIFANKPNTCRFFGLSWKDLKTEKTSLLTLS